MANDDRPISTLASRYRYLFVLPSSRRLIVYVLLATFVFSLLVSRDVVRTFLVLVFSTFVSVFLLRIVSKLTSSNTITYKRTLAIVLVDLLIIIFCQSFSVSYLFHYDLKGISNIVAYSIFASLAFNLVVVSTLTPNNQSGLPISIIFPSTLYLALLLDGNVTSPSIFTLTLILPLLALSSIFLINLSRKEPTLGLSPITVLRAYIFAWVNGERLYLEEVFSRNAIKTKTRTTVVEIHSDKRLFIIVPGIHSGPIDPVGSYDLPELFYTIFSDIGLAAVVHGAGSHEMNLVRHSDCESYVEQIKHSIASLELSAETYIIGPLSVSIDKSKIGIFGINKHILVFLSSAPYGSDDIDYEIAQSLSEKCRTQGLECTLIDAHNSIVEKKVDSRYEDVVNMLKSLRGGKERIRVGWANSGEVNFRHGRDLFEAGITVILLKVHEEVWAIVTADSNNAVPELRNEIELALEKANIKLLEFCTSDTHKLAGRGKSSYRGYFALGEETPKEQVVELVSELATIAKQRLSEARVGVIDIETTELVVGKKNLSMLANMLESEVRFAKKLSIVAGCVFVLSLVGLALI